jgi:hypothetical protein
MAARLAQRENALYAVLVVIEGVSFSWKGVLTARGKVRVDVVGSGGDVLMSQRYRTGTLVGSRGDRHDALIYFVAEQGAAMAFPRLRQVLAR